MTRENLTEEEIEALRKKMIIPKTKGDEYHVCICQACEDHFEAPWKEFMEHCQKVHGVVKNEEGTREMLMHLDGKNFFEWRYTCKFGDKVTFLECNRQKRRGLDKAMWR